MLALKHHFNPEAHLCNEQRLEALELLADLQGQPLVQTCLDALASQWFKPSCSVSQSCKSLWSLTFKLQTIWNQSLCWELSVKVRLQHSYACCAAFLPRRFARWIIIRVRNQNSSSQVLKGLCMFMYVYVCLCRFRRVSSFFAWASRGFAPFFWGPVRRFPKWDVNLPATLRPPWRAAKSMSPDVQSVLPTLAGMGVVENGGQPQRLGFYSESIGTNIVTTKLQSKFGVA